VSHRVRFTQTAEADIVRFYGFIPEREETNWVLAERALEANTKILSADWNFHRSAFAKRAQTIPYCAHWSFHSAHPATWHCSRSTTSKPQPFWLCAIIGKKITTKSSLRGLAVDPESFNPDIMSHNMSDKVLFR